MAATQKHIVKKGETLSEIAKAYMIVDWKKEIWAAPFNKELRKKTKVPSKIEPGWEVFVPKIKMPTGKIYAQIGLGKWSLNRPDDLKTIKQLLNKHAKSVGFKEVSMTPKVDSSFLTALKAFQKEKCLRVDGVITPDGATHKALSKPAAKKEDKRVRVIKIGGKQCAGDDSEIEKCLKQLSNSLSEQVRSVEERIASVRRAYNILHNDTIASAAVLLAGNMRYYKTAGDNLSKAETAIKKAKTKVAQIDAKSMSTGDKHRRNAITYINIAGRTLQKTVDDSGASVDAFLDVVSVADDVSTVALEIMLTLITRKPVLASAITAGYKQSLTEAFSGLLNSSKWTANGGFKGATCRVAIKSAEGVVLSKVGGAIAKRLTPFADEMGRYIQKSGLIGKVIDKNLRKMQPYLFKKYGGELLFLYPNLVEADISMKVVNKAVDVVWSTGSSSILEYFVNWYNSYHIDICNRVVKLGETPEIAGSAIEKKAKSEKVCRPLVEKFVNENLDKIGKEVVVLMKNKANAPV
ncbi:peptidoglycan-binding domain-containing protein [Parasedimentitalea huanghaiensis]|uniref:LysM peptidoglycan-binding domain-containing protein n=1 Tax=Parasedimentitalea huanghaiensis TaxID=2682100 RepID=A0A6L6WC47_9RHOB|nr:peptidoglycan-binding domain-containing protein [Zongyanglinia huanghaiensis]MVO14791.1 LysM peptidoglycan-binding domain-containing protein [Zongyanglinia huanghaiensis]